MTTPNKDTRVRLVADVMTDEDESAWVFFKNEQKVSKQLRKDIVELRKQLQFIGNLEKSVRDMELENTRLRAEVKRLLALTAALGEEA
jgi:hypothetical protein